MKCNSKHSPKTKKNISVLSSRRFLILISSTVTNAVIHLSSLRS